MKVALSWLRRYVDIQVPVEELCHKMTMAGFEVEEIIDLSETMKNVVAAKILKIEKHPDADKLQVCKLDVGAGEPVQIITGADNVFEGATVPAALHKSKLPNGTEITKGKLRGLPSDGMLCSGEELCLKNEDYPGAEVHGILILEDGITPGTDMRDVLHMNDIIIDFSITANRPDCQSVLGVAREVAVVLNQPFYQPKPTYKVNGGDIHQHISVTVEDYDLCPRYMGRVVKNLRIKQSPDWMKKCLKAAGMRPINNIVDITNFVMLETGNPMHAFDMRDLKASKIIVRHAKNGEKMTTLDGKDHTLNESMLVIADGENPSCIAGIMGGLDSEIKPDTTDLFLESAKFRRDNVRRTGRTLGMRTESSARFEKGIDIHGVRYAMERALQLIDELDAGDIIDGTIDCNNGLPEPRTIVVPAEKLTELLGVPVPSESIVTILNSLCIETTIDGNGVLTCKVPSFRDDVEGRADLAEEVMRIYGYDKIISTPMRGEIVRGKKLPERIAADNVKKTLTACGLREITTYSFISPKVVDSLRLSEDDPRRQTINLLNPLSEDYGTMRSQLATSMLTVLATNYNRKIPAAKLFEVSKIYVAKSLPLTAQPDEIPTLCIGLYGEKEDFFTLKGIVDALLHRFGIEGDYTRSGEPYLHPGRQAAVTCDGTTVAVLGEVHPLTGEKFGIGARAYLAEIPLYPLFAAAEKLRTIYKPLPKFPASTRDLSLLAAVDLPVAAIEKAIKSAIPEILEEIHLFDVYQGNQVPEGKKSVSYSISLRAADRTLTVEECDEAVQKIFDALTAIQVELRK